MANDPREDIVINPELFFVPEDVIDVRAGTGETNPEIPAQPVSETEFNLDEVDIDSDILEDGDFDASMQTPQWLSVISQTVRVSPDGRSVVDITFEVEDVPGAVDYELRVSQ